MFTIGRCFFKEKHFPAKLISVQSNGALNMEQIDLYSKRLYSQYHKLDSTKAQLVMKAILTKFIRTEEHEICDRRQTLQNIKIFL